MSEEKTEDERAEEGRKNYRRAREIASEIVDLVDDEQIPTYHARLSVLFMAAVELVGIEGMSYLRNALCHEPDARGARHEFNHSRFARSRR